MKGFQMFCVKIIGLQPKLLLSVPHTRIMSKFSEVFDETSPASQSELQCHTVSSFFCDVMILAIVVFYCCNETIFE
jgi:hypothetical protein